MIYAYTSESYPSKRCTAAGCIYKRYGLLTPICDLALNHLAFVTRSAPES